MSSFESGRLAGEVRNFVKRNRTLAKRGVKLIRPDPKDIHRITAEITRPVGGEITTPFDGKTLKLVMYVPNDYPQRAPTCRFLTYVFHPNVRWSTGDICLNILTDPEDWTNETTLDQIVCYIEELLSLPNCDSPYNCDAATVVREGDTRAYRSLVDYYLALSAQRDKESDTPARNGQRVNPSSVGLPEGAIIYDKDTDNYYLVE